MFTPPEWAHKNGPHSGLDETMKSQLNELPPPKVINTTKDIALSQK
jgi:hypothetical protein